jgi:hypothetical protein
MSTNVEQNQLQTIDENPQGLIALAIEKGVDIDKLERLFNLKEKYDAAQANKSFLNAMAKFQKDCPEIIKNKQVGYTNKNGTFTGYKFAELGQIDATIKNILADNGLSKRWENGEDGDFLTCTCIVSHIDGHTERTFMKSLKDSSGGKNEIQSIASSISYMQRYTLIGALGITTANEDNDGDSTPVAPNNTAATQQPTNSDLPWLNIVDKFGKKTKEGLQIEIDIAEGRTTILDLRKQYKISKAVGEELAKVKIGSPTQAAIPILEPVEAPFEIPTLWYAKMDKCRTKADVLQVYNNAKETIDAHPELQQLLKDTSKKFVTN